MASFWRRDAAPETVDQDPAVPSACERNPRVLMLHLAKPSNSEAKVLGTLLKHLEGGIEVFLIVNKAGDHDSQSHLVGLAERTNITVISSNVGLPIDPWQPPSRLRRLLSRSFHSVRSRQILRQVRRLNVDVVYTSQQRFDCRLGARISRRLGIPHVIHLHYTVGPWLRRPTLRSLRTCARVIAISEFIRNDAIRAGVDSRRVEVLLNTVEVPDSSDESPSLPLRPLTIGQTGRISGEKGFRETVEVFAQVHRRFSTTHLLLVGDGPARSDVEAAIVLHGLEHSAQITGWMDDIPAMLSQVDIFLNPSRAEPFGLAVLEAMANGIPVVAYGDGGVSEIVEDGVTGFLIAPENLGELTSAVTRLIAEPELRRNFGLAGRERARVIFDPANAANTFVRLLADVADG